MNMKLTHDLHLHTYLSTCCKAKDRQTPGAILELAESMGVETIGFADHIWVNPDIPPPEWYRPQDQNQISRLRADLASISSPVRVLVGCEADMIAPGQVGLTPEFARELDFVLLACSHFHFKFAERPASPAPRDIAALATRFFRAAVTSGIATVIAHPFLLLGYMDRFDAVLSAISDDEFFDLFSLAAGAGVGIEVNASFLPSPRVAAFSIETPIRFLSIAKKAGCKFTFGTDAHDPESQKKLPELMSFARALNLTREHIMPFALTPDLHG